MPKAQERFLFNLLLKSTVDNTTADEVLIDQCHRMYLMGAEYWT